MSNFNFEVIIIGGSLAGLFAGVVLQTLPNISKITILERLQADKLHDLGAGIRLNQEATDAFTEVLGVSPDNYASSVNAYRFLDQEGKVFIDHPTKGWTTSWGQLFREFREFYDKDPRCVYRHGCKLEDLHDRDDTGMEVEFTNEKGEKEKLVAKLVVGADGASSRVRSLVHPEVERISAGYVIYRGIVPLSEVSEAAGKVYDKAGTFSWPSHGQFVSYIVPGNEAPAYEAIPTINWAWYRNKNEQEMKSLMTDTQGILHKFQLPHGSMRQEESEQAKAVAWQELPAVHAEVVERTEEPFIQVVTDSSAPNNCLFNGKVLLVGDAVGGQRPHSASAVMQGTYHALMIRKLLLGEIDSREWTEETQKMSMLLVTRAQELGTLLMTSGEPPSQKVPAYMKLFLGLQKELNTLWMQTIGIGAGQGQM